MTAKEETGVVAGRFRLAQQIGSGSHCRVYKALDQVTAQHVAVKVAHSHKHNCFLKRERKINQALCAHPGFAQSIWYGRWGKDEISVTELLGLSLLDHTFSGKLSIKSVLMLAEQLLTQLEVLHDFGYLHADLKPDNCLMGLAGKTEVVHLIDFSLSRKYAQNGIHKKAKQAEFFGNPYWASVKVLSGLSPSRQDEIESLCTVFLFLLTKCLPWQHLRHPKFTIKRAQLLNYRKTLPLDKTFHGLPSVFPEIVAYARSLQHEDRPDYGWIRGKLKDLAGRLGIEYDNCFDWGNRPTTGGSLVCLMIMRQERVLESEGDYALLEEKKELDQGRKRANSADEELTPLLKPFMMDLHHSDTHKKSVNVSSCMRTLAVYQQNSLSPGALLSRRSSTAGVNRRSSLSEVPKSNPESPVKRRISIAETEEELTDEEQSLPQLQPSVRGKISKLKG